MNSDKRRRSDEMKKNILLTGGPAAGKTAVIKKVIDGLNVPVSGFYIEKEGSLRSRTGLLITTLDGKQCRLAHQDVESCFRIGKYGVSIENIEHVAVPSIAPVESNVIVIDGIGKMECLSGVFRKAVLEALNSPNIVIGTISFREDDFLMKIRMRKDVEIHEVTWNNRRLLPDFLLKTIKDLLAPGRKKIPARKKQQLENSACFSAKTDYKCLTL